MRRLLQLAALCILWAIPTHAQITVVQACNGSITSAGLTIATAANCSQSNTVGNTLWYGVGMSGSETTFTCSDGTANVYTNVVYSGNGFGHCYSKLTVGGALTVTATYSDSHGPS